MTKPKLTQWFDGRKFNPHHVGVYKVKPAYCGARTYFCYWNGQKWGAISNWSNVAEHLKILGITLHFSSFGWRGLTEEGGDV